MDRLQKKCVIATSACHGLLVSVLLFGSALMPKANEESNAKLFTAYDSSKISMLLDSQGGDPDVKPPPATQETKTPTPPTPPPPTPKSAPPKVEPPKIDPPKVVHNNDLPKIEPTKIPKTKPKPEPKETTPKPERKIDLTGLKPVKRAADDKTKAANDAADAEAKARARRTQKDIASAVKNLSKNFSSSTLVQTTPGPGGGGEVSIAYRDLIASKYYNAWTPPLLLDENTPVVTVSVTVAKDGNVVSARITHPSGNAAMDKSVQSVLENVKYFEPFPASSTDQEKTFTVQFNLQAKRQTG